MKPWRAILAALVIFCAGVVTGGLTAKLLLSPAQNQTARPIRPSDSANQRLKEALKRLDLQLKLSTNQWAHIEIVLRDSQDHMRKLWQSIAPQSQENIKQTQQKIRDILTADQKTLFDDLCRFRGRRKPDDAAARGQPAERRRGGTGPGKARQNTAPGVEDLIPTPTNNPTGPATNP